MRFPKLQSGGNIRSSFKEVKAYHKISDIKLKKRKIQLEAYVINNIDT